MARARKTADLAEVVEMANRRLEQQYSQEQKALLFCFVSDMLIRAGAYAGFNYLEWTRGGYERWVAEGGPEDKAPYLGPEFDRFFYTHHSLKGGK